MTISHTKWHHGLMLGKARIRARARVPKRVAALGPIAPQWTVLAAVLLAGLYHGSDVAWSQNWPASAVQWTILVAVALSGRFPARSAAVAGTALLILYVKWPAIDAAPGIVGGYAILIITLATGRNVAAAIWASCHLVLAGLHLSVTAVDAGRWWPLTGGHLIVTAASVLVGLFIEYARRRQQCHELTLFHESECRASSAALTLHDSVAHGAAQALWLTRELQQKPPESVSADELMQIAQACEAVVHDARQVMTSLTDNRFEIQMLASKKQPAGTNLHNSRGGADELPPLPSRAKTWLSEF